MCGLIAVVRKDGKPAARSVVKRYHHQKGRGQQGFGYVAIQDNTVVSCKRSTTEREILDLLAQETASEIWFHHRFPTSTPNIIESAHPLRIAHPKLLDHQYLIFHNGVIRNTGELYDQHRDMGFVYQTQCQENIVTINKTEYEGDIIWNDSESLAIETALAMEGVKGFIDTEGAAAVLGLQLQGKKVVQRFLYRNVSNPLVYFSDNTITTLTSVGSGRDIDTTRIVGMTDGGELTEIKPVVITPTAWKTTYQKPSGKDDAPYNYSDYGDDHMGFDYRNFPLHGTQHVSKLLPAPRIELPGEREEEPLMDMLPEELWEEHETLVGEIGSLEHDIEEAEEVLRIDGRVSAADYGYCQDLRRTLESKERRLGGVRALIQALVDQEEEGAIPF